MSRMCLCSAITIRPRSTAMQQRPAPGIRGKKMDPVVPIAIDGVPVFLRISFHLMSFFRLFSVYVVPVWDSRWFDMLQQNCTGDEWLICMSIWDTVKWCIFAWWGSSSKQGHRAHESKDEYQQVLNAASGANAARKGIKTLPAPSTIPALPAPPPPVPALMLHYITE